MLDRVKLKELAKEIYEIAVAHGWHEEAKPNGLWMALVVSEVAEAIEADRKNRRATVSFYLLKGADKAFKVDYDAFIKDSVEEELADIVIRLLDYIGVRWGDKYDWWYNPFSFRIPDDFPVAAWKLIKEHLNEGSMNVRGFIQYVLEWAIDIEYHIRLKVRYISLRPYRHGGKKY